MDNYTQNNEQEAILNYFSGRAGFFCDIGAYDGVTFSNVRALAELGWSGICYEPDRDIFARCSKNYKMFPDVVVRQAAVGTYNGTSNFYPTKDSMIGTTTNAHFFKWGKESFGEPYDVPIVDINDALKSFKRIDFLSIDTEGTNKALFDHLSDYHLRRIQMVCIEHDGHEHEIGRRFKSLGYTLEMRNHENIIYRKKRGLSMLLWKFLDNYNSRGIR